MSMATLSIQGRRQKFTWGFPGIRGADKCTRSAATKGIWGHAPPGKFCISDIVRSFLVHFGVKSKNSTSYDYCN